MYPRLDWRMRLLLCVMAGLGTLGSSSKAIAQGTTGPSIRDSNVGYIDPAVPADLVRLRFDAGYNNRRPTRAE
ncbi:MAG TPA: hypothetical protein VKI65_09645, partial [Gemmataceae bacterium]|nr:hypothetical protein [Gemmataceae bacterium]